MKKYNVFKVLLIALAVAIVLSFLIPQSTIGYTGIEKGKINPITLIDCVSNGLTSFSVFIASFVYILSIGIFYGVLKKSEKYDAVITNTAAKFNNKKVFVIISVLTFGILTACIGDVMPMLIFVPAFIDVAKKMGYDSKASILSTVGAMILGSAGSLYTNYTNQILATKVTDNIIAKIIILVVSLAALILFVVLTSKTSKQNKKSTKNIVGWGILGYFIPLAGLLIFVVWRDKEKENSRLSGIGALCGFISSIIFSTLFFIVNPIVALVTYLIISLIIILGLINSNSKDNDLKKEKVEKGLPISLAFDIMLVLIILGTVSWNGYFGFTGFSDFFESMVDFKVFKISLFNAIIGQTLVAFGEWTIYSLIVLLLVVSFILSLIYRIKFDALLETIANGIKKSLPYALILVLANVVLVAVYNSGFYTTVITSVGAMKDSILSSSTISALSSVAYPDYSYASQFTLSTLATVISNTKIYVVLAFLFQAIYSLVLLISPTSILILMALRYENVSYKDWIKYIYKFFLGLLILYFIIIIIIGSKFVKTISFVVLAVLIVMLVLFIVLSKTRKEKK